MIRALQVPIEDIRVGDVVWVAAENRWLQCYDSMEDDRDCTQHRLGFSIYGDIVAEVGHLMFRHYRVGEVFQ